MATLPLFWWACSHPVKQTASGLTPSQFETTVDGKPTALYILKNDAGMEVCITNFGGRIVSILVPDRNGEMRDVVLGFDNINDYLTIPSDFGASIGRYANRIDHGRLIIDEDTLQLPLNNFGHCLHGGPEGWQYKVYEAQQLDGKTLELFMHSPDGDENFPGNVEAKVTYTLTDDNAIVIAYEATTDAPTVINMTNHSYFNLSGDPRNTILDHILTINADSYTPVDTTYMTTGEILPVEGTPMDFRQATAIGAQIADPCEQLENAHGYDHNWVLAAAGNIDTIAARLVSPETGICLTVRTTEPGIQVYSGNFLDGTTIGKGGITYNARTALCLETQHYPDSPNKSQWPSTLLRPGETYRSLCIYEFTVAE
ncbi:MAG: galactose mutarotase [Porphyromonadaceae bacterium]|nr:galactose mutarotase [Porphyromonadaceae bacterium]